MRRHILLILTLCTSVALGILLVESFISTEPTATLEREPTAKSRPAPSAKRTEESHESRKAAETPTALPKGGVRVVLVSVDGFRTDLVQSMPGFRRMMAHGAWTLRATTTVPSITTTAHASMFTGQPPEAHGVVSGAPRGPGVKDWHPLKTPTIFEGLDPDRYKPSAFVQKEKLFRLLPDGAFVKKVLDRATRESRIVSEVCKEIAKPDGSRILVVHLKRFDAVGHDDGWMSEAQVKATGPMDEALLAVSECIHDAQSAGPGAFALIVTADHGGHAYDHDSRDDRDMHIPWLVIGPGVKADHEIRRAVHIMDTAAVVRYFLGYGERVHDGIRGRFPREILMH